MSDAYNRIFTNGELSADSLFSKLNYTVYVNPYLVLRPDGHYTKHIFMDQTRLVSKIGNPEDYDAVGTILTNMVDDQVGYMENYIEDNVKQLKGLDSKIILDPDSEPWIESEMYTIPADLGLSDGDTGEENLRYFFSKDHLGSASMISNSTGILIQHLIYAPFGETFVDMRAESFGTPYRFTGKEQDCETGLYYYGARYYDSRLSRFLSVDPLASEFPGWSPYNYTLNNPLKFTDPTGMGPESIHKDKYGNIIYTTFDGDSNTYVHDDIGGNGQHIDGQRSRVKQKMATYGTSGGGRKVDEFNASANKAISGLASLNLKIAKEVAKEVAIKHWDDLPRPTVTSRSLAFFGIMLSVNNAVTIEENVEKGIYTERQAMGLQYQNATNTMMPLKYALPAMLGQTYGTHNADKIDDWGQSFNSRFFPMIGIGKPEDFKDFNKDE